MTRYMKFLLAPLVALPAEVAAQSDQTWATYITEEQWQTVNEEPGVDRKIISRDIGELNLSVGIIHRTSTREQADLGGGGGSGDPPPGESCGVTSSDRDSGARGGRHLYTTETYLIVSGSGTLVTGGEIMNGRASQRESAATTLNGPSCSGQIVGDWVSKHVKEGDIVIIPAGTPHGWLDVPAHVDYLSVRPDPDRVLSDDYINPALGDDFEMRTSR